MGYFQLRIFPLPQVTIFIFRSFGPPALLTIEFLCAIGFWGEVDEGT